MTYTKKIANFEGYEFSQEFDCSETGAKEPVLLSGNNNGGIMGVVTYEYTPAVKEKLVEVYEMPSAMDPATYATFTLEVTSGETTGGAFYFETLDGTKTDSATILSGDTAEQIATKLRALEDIFDWTIGGSGTTVTVTYSSVGNITNLIQVGTDETTTCDFTYDDEWVDGTWEGGSKQERVIFVIDAETNNGGNITIDYNGTEVITAILNTDDADAIADKLVADVPTGYIANNLGEGMAIELVCEEPGAHATPISIDAGTTGVTFTDFFHTAGVDATGGEGALVPGNIEVFFNSDEAVEVAIEEGDELEDVYAKIAALEVDGYTITSDSNISIECDVGGAHTIPLSIDLGTTGITKTSSTLTEGADEFSNNAESVVIKTERTIDTRERIVADTAQWVTIDDDISANTYTEEAFSSPWTAIRVNCKTAESGAVARLIIRTAE